jgi:branched-chain amino acid transport system ATP-binding protein
MPPDNKLEVTGITAGYGNTVVIEDISFSVAPGQRVGIIGRNGAGKTSTLATIMGLTNRRSGAVRMAGRDISSDAPFRRACAGLGYVAQTRNIFASLSVAENLIAGLQRHSRARLDVAYAMFPRLWERRSNYGNQLSGGEQQMLAIARALMAEPAILLLDEPLEGLSPKVAEELMTAIVALAEQTGVGCVLVEQHVDLVLDFSSDIMVLERGRCVFSGSKALLNEQPEVLERAIGLSAHVRI